MSDLAWRLEAACRDQPTELFFPDGEAGAGPGMAVCARCPVTGPCLVAGRGQSGVWGGRYQSGIGARAGREPQTWERNRSCKGCGRPFWAAHQNARYCGEECRAEANRAARQSA